MRPLLLRQRGNLQGIRPARRHRTGRPAAPQPSTRTGRTRRQSGQHHRGRHVRIRLGGRALSAGSGGGNWPRQLAVQPHLIGVALPGRRPVMTDECVVVAGDVSRCVRGTRGPRPRTVLRSPPRWSHRWHRHAAAAGRAAVASPTCLPPHLPRHRPGRGIARPSGQPRGTLVPLGPPRARPIGPGRYGGPVPKINPEATDQHQPEGSDDEGLTDAELAGALVQAAGRLAAEMRLDGLTVDRKTSISDVVSDADKAAEAMIVGRLAIGPTRGRRHRRRGRRRTRTPNLGHRPGRRHLQFRLRAACVVFGVGPDRR